MPEKKTLEQAVVYLARHGAPDRSRKDLVYHLPPGPPLCQEGIAEAGELAMFALNAGVTRIISSPLERCYRTALIAGERLSLDVVVDERLMEMQPDESHKDVLRRAWPAFDAAAKAGAADGPVMLLTHGGVIHALLLGLGLSNEVLRKECVFDFNNLVHTAGVWEVSGKPGKPGWSARLAFTPQGAVEPAPAD